MEESVDVAAVETRLHGLTIFELRNEWRRLHQTQPPSRLSRDLLSRGITYKQQERVLGGLSKSIMRKLVSGSGGTEAGCERRRAQAVSLKPGTRLVRDWHGVTHTVIVLEDGVEWRGARYRSLSIVAREITGARWSGPRFFGLTTRRQVSNG